MGLENPNSVEKSSAFQPEGPSDGLIEQRLHPAFLTFTLGAVRRMNWKKAEVEIERPVRRLLLCHVRHYSGLYRSAGDSQDVMKIYGMSPCVRALVYTDGIVLFAEGLETVRGGAQL